MKRYLKDGSSHPYRNRERLAGPRREDNDHLFALAICTMGN